MARAATLTAASTTSRRRSRDMTVMMTPSCAMNCRMAYCRCARGTTVIGTNPRWRPQSTTVRAPARRANLGYGGERTYVLVLLAFSGSKVGFGGLARLAPHPAPHGLTQGFAG